MKNSKIVKPGVEWMPRQADVVGTSSSPMKKTSRRDKRANAGVAYRTSSKSSSSKGSYYARSGSTSQQYDFKRKKK